VPIELTVRADHQHTGAPPWYHLIGGESPQAFIVAGSALFAVSHDFAARLSAGEPSAEAELAVYRRGREPAASLDPLPRVRAISLNVAQSCNLACSYCYADEGRFGGAPRRMSAALARRAVDDLIEGASPGDTVLVGFIGGEPLLNRAVVHDCVAYASARAASASVGVGFSITTNGTVLQPRDLELLRAHPFAVTVSVDGGQQTHDRHRRRRDGSGSWQQVIDGLQPLLEQPGSAQVSARATVTRDDLDIAGIVEDLAAAGFAEVGVSPARTGPNPALLLSGADWQRYLDGLVDAADAEIARLRAHKPVSRWQFANLGHALTEIHQGSARALPCGAAHQYVSVDADGRYWTCHRTVGDERFELGRLGALSDAARTAFLSERLVDHQEPCRSCWARYLCGGGCHAEVAQVGRAGCDMIRGWLEFCLAHYPVVRAQFPGLFPDADVERGCARS
jgi:uncharacterized protein